MFVLRQALIRVSVLIGSLILCACGSGSGGDGTETSPVVTTPLAVTLTANMSSITYGTDITLTWSSTNATSCTASGAWSGAKATGGTETLRPSDESNNFQLSCTGAGGSAQASASVAVQPQQATSTPTSANPVISLGELSVNLTGQTNVQNTLVTMEKFSSATINAMAADDALLLDTDLSDADTYRIVVSAAPIAQVPITLQTGTRYAATDRFPVIYYQSEPSEDSNAQFVAVSSNYVSSGELTGSIPAEAFVNTAAGQYKAVLKIGLAVGHDQVVVPTGTVREYIRKQRHKVAPSAVAAASIPCPLATCTETSQFNPKRKIPQYTEPRVHKGTDFLAPAPGQAISGIAGSIVVGGKNDATNTCGRHIILRPPTPRVQLVYCHLSEIDPDLLNANGGVGIGKILLADNHVGTTGNSGAGNYPYHLHFELWRPGTPICSKGTCKYTFDKAESVFPYLVSTFKIKDIADKALRPGGIYSIDIEATSIGASALKSTIDTVSDNQVPGSPTRKICLTSNNQVSISYSTDPPELLQAGPVIDGDIAKCAPWGKPIKITAISNMPNTIVKARYSTRADIPLAQDRLSDHVAEITLDGIGGTETVEEFVDWAVNDVKVARSVPESKTLRGEDIDGNGGKRYIDLSAYKNPATATDTQPEDLELTVENVSISGATQITDGTADCLNLSIDRDFRYGTIVMPNPIAESIAPGIIYVMQSCEYVTRYSTPAGTVTIQTRMTPLADDPATMFTTENGLQVAYGSFDFRVTDQESARIGGFALGDKHVTGTFQFKLGPCSVQNGCPLH